MKKIMIIISYTIILAVSATYVVLDTFVLETRYSIISDNTNNSSSLDEEGEATPSTTDYDEVTESSITVTTYRQYDTAIYVADIYLGSGDSIKTYLAKGVYGKNVTETVSEMADEVGATLAINGDFYGARNSGYVIRNGILLRSAKASEKQEDLAIYEDGSMSIISEGDYTAQQLLDAGAVQVLSFGPGLVEDGKISVSVNEEVGQAKASNPRTAIGYISDNHYILVVADGRTDESAGLTLYQLAEYMKSLGVTSAYNLDGGGSSTMVYNGTVINNPTTNGDTIVERKVSDIIYVN